MGLGVGCGERCGYSDGVVERVPRAFVENKPRVAGPLVLHLASRIGDYPYKLTIQSVLHDPVPRARGVRYLTVNVDPAENSEHLRTKGFSARFRPHRCRHACRRAWIQV